MVFAGEEAGRADLFGGSLGQETLDEIVGGEIPVAREAVEPVQFEVLLEMVYTSRTRRPVAGVVTVLEDRPTVSTW